MIDPEHRVLVTPAKRGKGGKPKDADDPDEQAPVRRHAVMTWAQRLKRVFNIDVEKCRICGGTAKVIGLLHGADATGSRLAWMHELAGERALIRPIFDPLTANVDSTKPPTTDSHPSAFS